MIAVIFEVWPDTDYHRDYLDLAASLRQELEMIEGFISVERFESLYDEGKLLSLSFFKDENSVTQWRNTLAHRDAQALGKNRYFRDYRLRIAEVLRDYGPRVRTQVPADSRDIHG
ncbi:MAG: antibiotic biosynthesis monooxygenase family protein [bacterium]